MQASICTAKASLISNRVDVIDFPSGFINERDG